jgi:hypothetical protein
VLAGAGPSLAAGVHVRFDPSSRSDMPFPTDLLTVRDESQNTGRRVNLPAEKCKTRPTDCEDVAVLNTLDGFNLQPRVSIPFSGKIDVSTVSSRNVFFVSLGNTLGGGGGQVVGINQTVWDQATKTLHAESDQLLDQHTRYALIVTNGIRDTKGNRIEAKPFRQALNALHSGKGDHGGEAKKTLKAYRNSVLDAVEASGIDLDRVVAASVFTTQSATAVLEKIRDRIKAMTPAPTATIIASFPRSDVAFIQWNQQVSTTGDLESTFLPVPALDIFPGAVDRIVFGQFDSPQWQTADKFIPAIGTRTGVLTVQSTSTLQFNLFVPGGERPSGGWPVAIFGHGFTDSKQGAPFAVASTLAFNGIASISINVVGHGGGAGGTLTIIPADEEALPLIIPDGGRGIDQDGDGTIGLTEGVNAVPPRQIIASRDGLRQTVADLMQLVRVIKSGIDVDADETADLDGNRIYYAGQSFGGIYGTKLIAIEPDIRAGVPNVPGGDIVEIARLSPAFRPLLGFALATRVPSLSNAGPFEPPLWGFDDSIPLRDGPAVTAPVPGAMPIQEVLDNTEWVSQAGNPVAYAPYLSKTVLNGVPHRPFIIQSAKGDVTVPNPTTSAIMRAADAQDRWTLYRSDLVQALIPGAPADPHTFLTDIGDPTVAELAVAAQMQIGVFFASEGTAVIDPDAELPFFEVPISADEIPLMEALNF